jgi:Ser/Thr protein kinase RdoA (MazF antagonist)
MHLGSDPASFGTVWRDLGRELAALHANVRVCPDPDRRLDDHARLDDHEPLIASLQADGYLNRDAGAWFAEILGRLRPSVAPDPGYRRFIHGDMTPSNVLVIDGRYRALIDWDDAGWADPAIEFRGLPLRVIDAVLAGYRTVNPIDGDDTAESRILWDKLVGALGRLRLEPRPPTAPTSPAPAARLIELFAAAVEGADSPIIALLRG